MLIRFSSDSDVQPSKKLTEVIQKKLIDRKISFHEIYINNDGSDEEREKHKNLMITFHNIFGNTGIGTAFIHYEDLGKKEYKALMDFK